MKSKVVVKVPSAVTINVNSDIVLPLANENKSTATDNSNSHGKQTTRRNTVTFQSETVVMAGGEEEDELDNNVEDETTLKGKRDPNAYMKPTKASASRVNAQLYNLTNTLN